MIADQRPMVADVSLFEVNDAPTYWYVYSIPCLKPNKNALSFYSCLNQIQETSKNLHELVS